ncbi:C-type natriuretic peptide [Myotis myotis]|uniref:Natriuretic peptide C n=1 Tax=Myotis myotis TaxID=51298 RepID=A0A7J7WIX7_MYOMY|nr:C-type natriuretic peptide [Myotis myotis]XP_036176690.1 C-type natriuretic peptide [Myotis myotis]KAF6337170.1 natriuretic peptide C [Myotis myotis]
MHLSQLLACALLLTLLSLWQSEAKPGVPSKGPRTPLGEVAAASQAESGGQRKRGAVNLGGNRLRVFQDTKTRWSRLRRKYPSSGNNCFGHKLDRIGAHSGMGC